MKILAVLAIIGCTLGATVRQSDVSARGGISSIGEEMVVEIINGMKQQMPCGYPELGVPPLSPLQIAEKAIAYEGKSYGVNGLIQNLAMYGLQDFSVSNFKMNVLTSRVNIEFKWNAIRTVNDFDVNAVHSLFGQPQKIATKGHMDITMRGFTVKVKCKYHLNILSQKMTIKDMQSSVTVDEVESTTNGLVGTLPIGQQVNRYLEELLYSGVNDNSDPITKQVDATLLPMMNNVLSQVSIGDLIGDSGKQKPTCAPTAVAEP